MAKSAADSIHQLISSDKEPQTRHHYDCQVRNSNKDSKGDVPFALPELSILTQLSADSIAHSKLITTHFAKDGKRGRDER